MRILTSLRNAQNEFIRKATAIQEAAAGEERLMTDDERTELNGYLAEAKALKAKIDQAEGDRTLFDQMQTMAPKGAAPAETFSNIKEGGDRGVAPSSYGEQFVTSEAFSAKRGAQFSTGAVEMGAAITTGGTSAGALIVPDQRAFLPILTRRLVIADLLGAGSTTSNSIVVPTENVLTNAAAAVLEGGLKPESAITYTSITEAVKKLATVIKISDESLEDIPYIRSLVDGRLRLFIEEVEENQVLTGDGIGANVLGLMNRAGLTAAHLRGTDTNFDAIHKQITKIALASFLYPDGVVVNPANWETMALSKDTTGRYIGGGPFDARQTQVLWGLPVVTTPAMAAGTALVGAFKMAAAIIRRNSFVIEMTNSNEDDFRRNLIALRAEERLALAVYRPSALGTVTGLA